MAESESWASSPAVRASMRGNRSRDTLPELVLRRALHAQGMRYFVNRRPIKALRRTADLVFPTTRVAVFVDGCFWHGCPQHSTAVKTNADYWTAKVQRNRERDLETDAALQEAGWTVVRLWEHEALDAAIRRVASAVREAER